MSNTVPVFPGETPGTARVALSRRAFVAGLGAAAGGPLLAACTVGQEGTPAGSATGPVTISHWYIAAPPTIATPAFEQAVSEFQAKQPAIRVNLELLTGSTTEQEQKILAASAAGTPPDLTYVHPISNATVATKGVTTPLEPYLGRRGAALDLRDFYPGAIDYFRWDGKLFALPNYSGPGVFYYNKNLIEKLALADPWELFQKGQWTSQKLDEYVLKLTSGQGETKVFGRHDISRSVRVQSPWIQGFGGEVWNAKVTETLLHEDGAVKAWEYLAEQLIRGYAPGPDDLRGVSGGVRTLFNGGRVAFYFGIRSEVSEFRVPFATVPVHKMPNGKEYNRDGPNGLALTQGSKQRDTAWQYLTFAVTRGVEINMGVGLTAPTTRTHAKSQRWLSMLVGGETAGAYDAAASQVKAIPHPPRLSDIDRLIQEAFGKVVAGQAAARAAMLEIKPPIDAILAGNG